MAANIFETKSLFFLGSFPCSQVGFLCQAATFYKNIFCISFLVATLQARRLNICKTFCKNIFCEIYPETRLCANIYNAHVCKMFELNKEATFKSELELRILFLFKTLTLHNLLFGVFKTNI